MLRESLPQSKDLYRNFIVFSCLFAVAHSTVNVVLAFAAAELGITAASYGGFSLYAGFTLSSFIFAKPVVKLLGVKFTLIAGMVCFMAFVALFCLSLLSIKLSIVLYVLGSCICGIGEGLYWTGQGIYFSMNSIEYAKSSNGDIEKTMTKFASTFAVLYLTIEACSKWLSSLAFSIAFADHKDGSNTWKVSLFAFYTIAVIASALLFYLYAISFKDKLESRVSIDNASVHGVSPDSPSSATGGNSRSYQYNAVNNDRQSALSINEIWQDCSSVASALYSKRLLQYVVPFQLAFGVNGVFMDSYINGVIVKQYLGEQYIGVLSGILSISSVLIAFPYSYVSLNVPDGSYYVMMFACCCFMCTALPLLLFSDATIGQWWFIVWVFILHGCARGAWENTNKAVIGEYFAVQKNVTGRTEENPMVNALRESDTISNGNYQNHNSSHGQLIESELKRPRAAGDDVNLRDTAFASVSFSSSLAGALGYICFKFFNRTELAILNIAVGFAAAVGFHQSTKLYQAQQQLQFAFEFNGNQQQESNHQSGYGGSSYKFTLSDEDDEDDDIQGVEFTVRKGFILDHPSDD